MLDNNYTPAVPVPDDCSTHYADGWRYADWFLMRGGSIRADSPDGWHDEKYEGWWDRIDEARRLVETLGVANRPPKPSDMGAAPV